MIKGSLDPYQNVFHLQTDACCSVKYAKSFLNSVADCIMRAFIYAFGGSAGFC